MKAGDSFFRLLAMEHVRCLRSFREIEQFFAEYFRAKSGTFTKLGEPKGQTYATAIYFRLLIYSAFFLAAGIWPRTVRECWDWMHELSADPERRGTLAGRDGERVAKLAAKLPEFAREGFIKNYCDPETKAAKDFKRFAQICYRIGWPVTETKKWRRARRCGRSLGNGL